MFDPAPPTDRSDFEAWLAGELRRPAPPDPARTTRVMADVRRAVPPARRQRRWAPPTLGLAVATGLAGLAALHPFAMAAPPEAGRGAAPRDASYRDTLVAAIGSVLRDTIRDTIRGVVDVAVRDTTRLVRFTLVAPAAVRVAVAGDFNGWNPRATPLGIRAADGTWSTAVPLAPGRHRYAFVVDDTQWVADPAAAHMAGRRPWSVRAVPDTTN